MEALAPIASEILGFLRAGFSEVNAAQGLVIAIIAALLLSRYNRILTIGAGATITHLAANVLIPIIALGAAFRLPPLLNQSYWQSALTLFLGYLVVITLFYVIKRVVFKTA